MRDSLRFYGRVFLATGSLFGVLSGLEEWFSTKDPGGAVVAGVVAGLIFGVFMAVVMGSWHVISARRAGVPDAAYGPVRQHASIVLASDANEAFDAAVRVIEASGATVKQRDPVRGRIEARTGLTWKSFGEKLDVTVLPQDQGRCEVRIESRPRVPSTVVDYGKNLQNVQNIDQKLRALFEPATS
ncbi:hypothetical protein [Nocardia sp. NPDC052566]|uniref:hypothetical protein n=1 Tax=Nocardia sp. NPDC052566 TaxID=3364330 RepID=UPI0037CA0905